MASEAQVPDSLHVNEATLELLERRIESKVKTSFFAWIGAPVGLAGIGAIVFTLFSYIPNNISSYLEKDPRFMATLDTAAKTYLADPKRGQAFLKMQIDQSTRAAVADQVQAEVAAYFADPAGGKKAVATQVTSAADAYFKTSGLPAIQQQVAAYLAGNEVKQLVRDQVKRELEPRLAGLLEPVMKNTRQQVTVVAALPDVVGIEKGALEDLNRALQGPKGQELRGSTRPVALTTRIRRGHVYDPGAIQFYLETLQRELPGRLRHVVIGDADGAFLARVDPQLFQARIRQNADPVMRVLNAGSELTPADARAQLNRLFDAKADTAIAPGTTTRDALRAPLWDGGPAVAVAVLDEQRRFLGTTTREQLLDAVFRPIAG
jgi:hypothetical protein